MVLRRCLAGALAVIGALAGGGYTLASGPVSDIPSGLPGRAAANLSGAIGARAHGGSAARRRVLPAGTGATLIATGAAMGSLLAAEVAGGSRHLPAPEAGAEVPTGTDPSGSHAVPPRHPPVPRRAVPAARRTARPTKLGSRRSLGRPALAHQRHRH